MQHFLSALSSNITNGTRHDELSPELQYKLDVIHAVAVGVAAIFMLASVALSLAHMILHLLNYTKPSHQVISIFFLHFLSPFSKITLVAIHYAHFIYGASLCGKLLDIPANKTPALVHVFRPCARLVTLCPVSPLFSHAFRISHCVA